MRIWRGTSSDWLPAPLICIWFKSPGCHSRFPDAPIFKSLCILATSFILCRFSTISKIWIKFGIIFITFPPPLPKKNPRMMIHWRYSWTLFWVWMWREFECLRKFEIWQRWNHFLNWPRCKNGRRNWNSCRRFSSDSLIILSGWLSVQFCLRDSNRPTLTLSVRHFSNHFWMPIWIWQGFVTWHNAPGVLYIDPLFTPTRRVAAGRATTPPDFTPTPVSSG